MSFVQIGVVVASALLASCASAPEAPAGEIHILGHTCDQWGVASVTVIATGETIATLRWSNEAVCGVPS